MKNAVHDSRNTRRLGVYVTGGFCQRQSQSQRQTFLLQLVRRNLNLNSSDFVDSRFGIGKQ
eukprot:scaffold166761_cov26-Tisochrysis_lutea.AAC.1